LVSVLPLSVSARPSCRAPSWGAQCFSEAVATFGLVVIIFTCAQLRPKAVAAAVAAYITAAYWFTSSTSFANPAVTLARTCSDTFAGIRPQDAPSFILAQCLGGALALAWTFLALPKPERMATE
jgi:glycerol uptake facilitator-like aquaporin